MVKKMPVDRHKLGRYSKNKGKRAERELAHIFQEAGLVDAHRTAQFMGKTGQAGDIEGVPFIHVEAKNVEKLNLRNAMAQSEEDTEACGKGEIPIVCHKKSRVPWLVTMNLADWIPIYKVWLKVKEKDNADK